MVAQVAYPRDRVTASEPCGFSHSDILLLRTRSYDASVGRFVGLDPFFGRLDDPQSFHKSLYVHGDPIQGIDPSGLEFSLSGQFSVSGIQGNIMAGTRYVGQAVKIYQRVNKLIELLDYAKMAVRFLRAFQATTPQGAAVALAAAIREQFGGAQAANQILQSFQAALSTIAPHWQDISGAITKHSGKVAAELAPLVALRIPAYAAAQAAQKFRLVFYLPTAPGARSNEHYISLGGEVEIATALSGGRLFGFGVRVGERSVEPLYRIDYWDVSRPIINRLHVHYHFPYFDGGNSHPPGRTIWEP